MEVRRASLSKLLRRVGRTVLAIFLLSVLAMSMLMILLPVDGRLSRHPRTGKRLSVYPAWMFDYRSQFILEVETHNAQNDVAVFFAIAVKFSVLLPFLLWKECAILVALYWFYPRLRGVLYAYTPIWFDDLSAKVGKTFSQDDHEPPPGLDVDETVMRRRGGGGFGSSLWPISASFRGSGGGASPSSHAGSPSNYATPGGTRSRQQFNGALVDADDWYVFDPVYGVIPITCRDLWIKQSREMEVRREASISSNRDRPVKPIRFSKDDGSGTRSSGRQRTSSSSNNNSSNRGGGL